MTKSRYLTSSPFCAWCGVENHHEGLFCTSGCQHEWRIRKDHAYMRRYIWERDGGVCCLCGLDTEDQARRLLLVLEQHGHAAYLEARREQGIPSHRATLWDVDHVRAVASGGGSCGEENLRTLCLGCHRERTTRQSRA